MQDLELPTQDKHPDNKLNFPGRRGAVQALGPTIHLLLNWLEQAPCALNRSIFVAHVTL